MEKNAQLNSEENQSDQSQLSSEQLRQSSVFLFTLSSTATILIIGLLIGWLIARSIRTEMVDVWGLSTGAQVNGAVSSFLSKDEMNAPIRGPKYKELRQNIDRITAETDIVEVKIWRMDGTLIFSKNRHQIGQKFPRSKSFNQAQRGSPSAEVSELEDRHNKDLRKRYATLIEIYYPIRFGNSDKVQGIFEIYLSLDRLNAHIRQASISLTVGLGLLGILLIVFAQFSSRMLRDRNDRVVEIAGDLKKSEAQSRRISIILQESLIKSVPDIPGLSTGIAYKSAYEAERVGGDFYDIFQLGEDQAAILVGDVAGKGVEAAGLTETIRSSVRAVASINRSPSFILNQLNHVLLPQVSVGEFATAVLMIVDINLKIVKLAIAGHPPPLVLGNTDYFLDTTHGLPLGVVAGDYFETSLELESGAGIILYTDGLIEARRETELFGQDRVLQVASTHKTSEPQVLVENLLRAATVFTRGHLSDDVVIVAFRFL